MGAGHPYQQLGAKRYLGDSANVLFRVARRVRSGTEQDPNWCHRRRQQTTPDGRLASLPRHIREIRWRMAVRGTPAVRRLGGRTRTIMTAPEKQMRLVIVGATGMVGGYALRYALAHPANQLVTTIGRRKIGVLPSELRGGWTTETRIGTPCCRADRGVSYDSCGYLLLPSGSGTSSVVAAPNTPSVPPKLKCLTPRPAFG